MGSVARTMLCFMANLIPFGCHIRQEEQMKCIQPLSLNIHTDTSSPARAFYSNGDICGRGHETLFMNSFIA